MYFENPDITDPDAAVTYAQGKLIALACGGIKNICPGYAEGASSAEALTEMGLTKGKASKVIEALAKAGLKQANMADPEKARKATQILNSLGGISCSVPAARESAPTPSRSTGGQAASSASVSRERLAALLGTQTGPERQPDEEDIEVLMLGRGMTRDQAIRFLRLIGKANPLRRNRR